MKTRQMRVNCPEGWEVVQFGAAWGWVKGTWLVMEIKQDFVLSNCGIEMGRIDKKTKVKNLFMLQKIIAGAEND